MRTQKILPFSVINKKTRRPQGKTLDAYSYNMIVKIIYILQYLRWNINPYLGKACLTANPPSTNMVSPVILLANGEAKKRTQLATSFGKVSLF